MLNLYIQAQFLRADLTRWLNRELDRTKRDERGLSEAVQNALLVVLAIAIVALLAAAVTAFINRKIEIIANS